MILLALSFIAGVLTILAPCTLPILPLMVGSSIVGGGESKTTNIRKAMTIAASLGISIVAFTFILKVSTAFIYIPEVTWSIVAGLIISIFGLVTVFPILWEKIPLVSKMNIGSNRVLGAGYQKKSFWGDVIIGAALGPVFSTCSPTYFVILATVLPQSFLTGFVYLVAYALGLSLMVLLVAFLGQKLVSKLGSLSNPNGWFKKTLGVIFLIIGVSIIFGFEKVAETKLLDSGIFDVTKVEQILLNIGTGKEPTSDQTTELNLDNLDSALLDGIPTQTCTGTGCSPTAPLGTSTVAINNLAAQIARPVGTPAPEITNPSNFINTDGQPITIKQFKGKKVVLIDFWTYSCINCQRSLPYVNAWYKKYKDQGLEIIGIHTPEFAFEKVPANVEAAVRKLGIEYPVVMDNMYGTWGAFNNNSWPRKYLIDDTGKIIYDHVGEGEYAETEKAIQNALSVLHKVNGEVPDFSTDIAKPQNVVTADFNKVKSPEVYFGSARNGLLANGPSLTGGVHELKVPTDSSFILSNALYLGGTWNLIGEYAESQSPAVITFKYNAKNVYMVASSDEPITLHIYLDGKKYKDVVVSENTLYKLIEGASYGEHIIRIETEWKGLKAYTFTFG